MPGRTRMSRPRRTPLLLGPPRRLARRRRPRDDVLPDPPRRARGRPTIARGPAAGFSALTAWPGAGGAAGAAAGPGANRPDFLEPVRADTRNRRPACFRTRA